MATSIQDLVSKDLDDIRNDMFGYLNSKQEEYYASGWLPIRLNLNKGIVRGLIELWCWGLYQLYLLLALVLKQAFPDAATGVWLDLHCRQVGVTRKPATKTSGTVYFTRVAPGGNVLIRAGRVVRTPPDGAGNVYRFASTADVVLAAGSLEVAAQVESEEYGAAANVTAGQISEMSTTVFGVDAVENRAGWILSEGADTEDDGSLWLRYQLAWKQLNGCTKYAYEAWAREIPGVVDVAVLDQHPRGEGTVDVLVVGAAGIPTQQLLDKVIANILGTGIGDEKCPINDDVEIRGPVAVNVAFTAELELTGGDPVATLSEAENRLRALFSALPTVDGITPLGVGVDVTLDRMKWAVMLPNVKRITTTFADVAVAATGLAVLTDVTLTWVWASEN